MSKKSQILIAALLFVVLASAVSIGYFMPLHGLVIGGGTKIQPGLFEEDGDLYYREEDGSFFTGGYRILTAEDGSESIYYFLPSGIAYNSGYFEFEKNGFQTAAYFQEDGTAYTGGYLKYVRDGSECISWFQEDGTVYTRGFLTGTVDGKSCHLFLMSNGLAYTGGYLLCSADGEQAVYWFGEDGIAVTDTTETLVFEDHNTTFYFDSDSKAVSDSFIEINGNTYYFDENGHMVLDKIQEIEGCLYAFDENGILRTDGWFSGDGYCCYACDDGKLATDTIVDNYILDSEGKTTVRYQILSIVNELTDDTMTDQEKINAIYDWMLGNDMYYFRMNEHLEAGWNWYDGWTCDFLSYILENRCGNCFRFACLLGYLIREATGLPVTIVHGEVNAHDSPHGWVEVEQDGTLYTYDVDMAKFASGGKDKWYHRLASDMYDSYIYHNFERTPLYNAEKE